MAYTGTAVARTPLHAWHARQGAHWANQDNWQVPGSYTTVDKEAETARTGLALADISAFAKVGLRGPGVRQVAQSLAPDSAALNPRSVAALASSLVCRLSDEQLLLLASSPASAALDKLLGPLQTQSVVRTDVTSAFAGLLLLGPHLEAVLSRLTHHDVRLASFPVQSCAETTLAGIEALLVRAQEFVVPSMRIYVAWDMAEYVWERVLEAGRDAKVTSIGVDALARLHKA